MRIFSAAFFLGTLAIWVFSEASRLPLLILSSCLLALVSIIFFYFINKIRRVRWIVLLVLGLALGSAYSLWTAQQVLSQQLPIEWESKDQLLNGKIIGLPVDFGSYSRFLFAVEQADFQGTLRLSWYGDKRPHLQAGEVWQLNIRAKRPHGVLNPGGFDYERWLFAQRIGGLGYVRNSKTNQRLQTASLWQIQQLRQTIAGAIQQALADSEMLGVVTGLAIGQRHGISPQQWDSLRITGTSHLLAISGLHIALVASLGFVPIWLVWRVFPALSLWVPVRVAGSINGALFACIYAALAGFTLPTQRALIMVLVLMLGLVVRRYIPPSRVFAFALFAVLLLDPLASLSAGFWLSFIAVAILLWLAQRRLQRSKWQFVSMQLALSLGMIPFTASLFAQVALVSPLANVFAIPYTTLLVVPLILLGIALFAIVPWLAELCWQLAAYLLQILFYALDILAALPLAAWALPSVAWAYLLLAVVGMVLLLLPQGMPGRWLGGLCLLPLFFVRPAVVESGAFRLSMLDVGQGLAAVVQTAQHSLVFDTGPRRGSSAGAGERVLLPWLQAQGIQHLDTLLISHADNDHIGGAQALLDTLPVRRLLTNDADVLTAYQPQVCQAGLAWQWDGVYFEILHPDANFSGKNRNNRACVLRVSNAYYSALLSADIERKAERWLLRQRVPLQADVLLVPHHGSLTSSSPAFLNRVAPQLALVSTGYRNRFHHPHPKVKQRYQIRDVAWLNTADSGEVRVDFPFKPVGIKIRLWRREQHYLWHRVSKK